MLSKINTVFFKVHKHLALTVVKKKINEFKIKSVIIKMNHALEYCMCMYSHIYAYVYIINTTPIIELANIACDIFL